MIISLIISFYHLPRFQELSGYYNFIDAGRTHIGDIQAELFVCYQKNNDRYDYVLFIDEERYLPLRVDLLDKKQ